MRLPAFLHAALDRANGSGEEPLRLLRLTAGGLLLFGTLVAVALAVSGMTPRALQLVAVFWALYGFIAGITSGVLEPVIDGIAHALQNFGLMRAGGGYSAIETLAVRGRIAEAAEAYRERARDPRDRVEATLRRARLLAGPLGQPETALVELQSLRDSGLGRKADLRVGLALVDLYDRRLAEPGKAMAELRRLIDRHPEDQGIRRLRHHLAALKSEHQARTDPTAEGVAMEPDSES